MTNFEYYKEEILEIINKGNSLGVCKNKPVNCNSIECSECVSSDGSGCDRGVYKWLYAEHKEQPKLTKKERQFCELVETGWIARSKNGCLNLFSKRPTKLTNCWFSNYNPFSDLTLFNFGFSFITWDDEEPWSIEDLLKLEVEE